MPLARACSLVALAQGLLFGSSAGATGMQGHIYMAECGAEQLAAGPLRTAVFDEELPWLTNGAFFPDSGYTADDHDQGEIPHWEGYVDAYVAWLRAHFDEPLSAPEAREHVAFLFGIAAHGITDSTFDSLLWPASAERDPGNVESLDTAMDVFLVHDLARHLVPDIVLHEDVLSQLFSDVGHPISEDAIVDAMAVARVGIAAVTNFLAAHPEERLAEHPWAHTAYLDPRTPGGYAFGARVVRRYYEELEKRLAGSADVAGLVIGTYPDATTPLAALDRNDAHARLVIFFGHGVDRASFSAASVVVRDELGNSVPGAVNGFRGDEWLNVVTFDPEGDWAADASYELVVKKTLVTQGGHSPSADIVVPFTAPCAGCEPRLGKAGVPPSSCPLTDTRHPFPADEPTGVGGGDAEPGAAQDEPSGCTLGTAARHEGALAAMLVGAIALSMRRDRDARRARGRSAS